MHDDAAPMFGPWAWHAWVECEAACPYLSRGHDMATFGYGASGPLQCSTHGGELLRRVLRCWHGWAPARGLSILCVLRIQSDLKW